MIKNETENLDKLNVSLNKISEKLFQKAKEIDNEVIKIVANGANDVRNTIIRSMQQTPRNERKQTSGYAKGKMRKYGPSFPENPPAIQTGQLIRSILWKQKGLEVEVGAIGGTTGKNGTSYAIYLEKGTKNMKKRPFLIPAVDRHKQDIIKKVENYTNKIMTVIGEESK